MKKIALFILSILLLSPSMVVAHTAFSTSNPTEGQVVTTELKEITLTYEGNIEKLSTMKLLEEGTDIPFEHIEVEDKQMRGTLPKPLKNGSYTIQWTIVGEDGHPIQGEIHFSVQLEEKVQQPAPTNPDTNQVNEDEQQSESVIDKVEDNQNKDIKLEDKNKDNTQASDSGRTMMMMGVLLIAGLGFLFFRRKKR